MSSASSYVRKLPQPIRAALLFILALAISYVYVYQAEPFPQPWTDIYLNLLIVLPSMLAAGLALRLALLFGPDDAGPRWVWRWFALAFILWSLAEITWLIHWLLTSDVPTPSYADIFWVLALLPFTAAFIQQFRLIYHPERSQIIKYTVLVAMGVLLLTLIGGWMLLRSTNDPAMTPLGIYLEVFYAAGDLGMLVVAIRLAQIFGRGMWGRAWWGLLAFVLSDGLYSYISFTGLYAQSVAEGNYVTLVVDLVYALAYQLMALALWSQYLLVRHGPTLVPLERIVITLTPEQEQLITLSLGGAAFLEGPAGSGKTSAAALRLESLLQAGTPGEQILVLTPQRALAAPYEAVLRSSGIPAGGAVTVWTPGSLAQRMVDWFWSFVPPEAGFGRPNQPPVFLNMETAQYFMAHVVQGLEADPNRAPLFESVSIDRNRLYSQIIDNLEKAALVGFDQREISERLKDAWQGEPGQRRVYDDVQTCADAFRQFCLDHNLLDFSLQVETFCKYLWPQPQCRAFLVDTFRHLMVDNLEEHSPFAHDVLRAWLPECDSALLIFDQGGGYRRFLGADPETGYALRELCHTHLHFPYSLVISPAVQALAGGLDAALAGGAQPVSPAPVTEALEFSEARFYPQMIDWVADGVRDLVVEQGLPPGEVVVLAPILSDSLRFALMDRLAARGVPCRSHRPSRALRDEPAAKALLTLAALAHPEWNMRPSVYETALALVQAIDGLDLVRAQLLAEIAYRASGTEFWLRSFGPIKPEMQARITYVVGERYETLRQWLMQAQSPPMPLDHFFSRLFGEVLSQPGFGFHTSYDAGRVSADLIDSARNFRWVVGPTLEAEDVDVGREYLLMVQNGLLAAQYVADWALQPEDSVLLAPAYTFLLSNRPAAVQFWLDLGSRLWSERLQQPLTHPFVLTRHWEPGRLWTDIDEQAFGRDTMRRVVIGLLHRCRERLFLGLSDLNEAGYEQRGPLLQAFNRVLRQAAQDAPSQEAGDGQ